MSSLMPAIHHLFLILASVLVADLATGATYIVQNGQANAAIVIAEHPTRMQQLAADELQAYIRKITGATLPMVAAPDPELPVCLHVGESEHTRRLGIDISDLAHGAYRIKSGDDYLALVGRDDDYFMTKPGDGGVVFPAGRKERKAAEAAWHDVHGKMWTSSFGASFKGYNGELGVWETNEHGSLNAVNDFLRYLPWAL